MCRGPQSVQSVPKTHAVRSAIEPGPPSSQYPLFDFEQSSVQTIIPGSSGGGGGGGTEGEGGGWQGGDEGGGGAKGGREGSGGTWGGTCVPGGGGAYAERSPQS